MKQFLMIFAVVASLCVFGSCSKDDDNGLKGGKISGDCHVDGNKFSVKYGYMFGDEIDGEILCYDKDVSKYMFVDEAESEDYAPDVELSCVYIGFYEYKCEAVDIVYKGNAKRGTGYIYEKYTDGAIKGIDYSVDGTKVKLSGNSLSLDKYKLLPGGDFDEDESLGKVEASFDISGNVSVLDDIDEYDATRSYENSDEIVITVVKDPKQFARLKALVGLK